MNGKFSVEEVKDLLRKDREKMLREAKNREAEIIALMEEQNLDYQGKLWGEDSIVDIAARKNNGDGTKWMTDVEAEICSDIKHYGIDHSVMAHPMRRLVVLEAWDLAKKTILGKWGKTAVKLFAYWLDGATVKDICIENDLPAVATLEFFKSSVAVCRKEAGKKDFSYFPFPEEEMEIKEMGRRVNRARSIKRILAGESTPADPENRIYLTLEEKDMPLDSLWAYLKAKHGVDVARSTVHRAKKTGWFMRPGWKRAGGTVNKVFLMKEDFELSPIALSERYGISKDTAGKAKKVGWFVINSRNRKKIKIINLADSEVRSSVRQELSERDGFYEVAGEKMVYCALCSGELPLKEATIDHIIPRAEGGNDILSNLCLAHEKCNKEKGSNISAFRESLQAFKKRLLGESTADLNIVSEIGGRKIKDIND